MDIDSVVLALTSIIEMCSDEIEPFALDLI